MKARTPQETANEQTVRKLYSLAEAATKDTQGFVSMFGSGGYFYDVAVAKKYYGRDIGVTVDNYATAFPDMHRELMNLYTADDVVVVELTLNGTHKGDLDLPKGLIPPTGREMHTPCCDVFHVKESDVKDYRLAISLRRSFPLAGSC